MLPTKAFGTGLLFHTHISLIYYFLFCFGQHSGSIMAWYLQHNRRVHHIVSHLHFRLHTGVNDWSHDSFYDGRLGFCFGMEHFMRNLIPRASTRNVVDEWNKWS